MRRSAGAVLSLLLLLLSAVQVSAQALPLDSGSGCYAYTTVADEGTNLTPRSILNFIGAGVTCVDNVGTTRTDCTVAAAGAPTSATFITQTPDAGLSAEQALNSLTADRLLRNTTGGVLAASLLSDTGTNVSLTSGNFSLATDAATLSFGAASDLVLNRTGPDILALQRGTNAQQLEIDKTCTGAACVTAREYLELGSAAVAGQFTIRARSSGTGTARTLNLNYANSLSSAAIIIPASAADGIDLAAVASPGTPTSGLVRVAGVTNITATGGTAVAFNVAPAFTPATASTLLAIPAQVRTDINYPGGSTGSFEMLRIRVLETSLPSGPNYLIRAFGATAGDVERFSVTLAGLLTTAVPIPVGSGGTGAATLTGVLHGNGTSAVTAANVNLASEVTGTLPYGNGGTGATSYTTNTIPKAGASAFADSLLSSTTNVTQVSGQFLRPDGTAAAPADSWTSETNSGRFRNGSNQFGISIAGTAQYGFGASNLSLASGQSLVWSSTTDPFAAADVLLLRPGANKLALRNGTNAQELQLDKTCTGTLCATSREYLEMGSAAVAGQYTIRSVSTGTGSARTLNFNYGNSTSSSAIIVPTATSTPLDLVVAPITGATTTGTIRTNSSTSFTSTSGTGVLVNFLGDFAPTSTSTLVAINFQIKSNINWSAGTPGAGSYEAMRIAMTETALPTGQSYFIRARGGSAGTTDKFTVTKDGHIAVQGTATPAISGCGTGATIVGSDVAGSVTIGTTPGTCVVTFNNAWLTNAPHCILDNEISAIANRATSVSTTTFTISGTLTASDVIDYICVGHT